MRSYFSSRALPRRLLEFGGILLLSALLLAGWELAFRGWRLVHGEDPATRAARFQERITTAVGLYREHPYLNTGPREGSRVRVFGKDAGFNSAGYRSPERPLHKPPGIFRVVCAGGSTTFDIAAADDPTTWPWRLEDHLNGTLEREVEVWNAGFPGWTSLENLVSLVQRDLRLAPDLLIFYQGINDLQPGSHQPFDPGYEAGHADAARRALGLELRPLHFSERLLTVEWVRELLQGPRDPWARLKTRRKNPRRLDRLPEAAVATFRGHVRSLVGLAEAHDVRVLLVTQPLRIRAGTHRPGDLDYLDGWLLGLDPERAPRELERFNDVLRETATGDTVSGRIELWDAAALPFEDRHFADPMHFSAAGSAYFAAEASRRVEELIAE